MSIDRIASDFSQIIQRLKCQNTEDRRRYKKDKPDFYAQRLKYIDKIKFTDGVFDYL